MSYELRVDAGVRGKESLDALTAATEKQAGSTARLNDVLYGQSKATEQLTLKQQQAYIEELKLEQLRERHRIALDNLANATAKAAAAQEAMAAGTQRVVGNSMAASSALRVMEGAMPLRAAASFLGTLQGIGPALQFVFPIAGAVALFEVGQRIVGAVDKWYDKAFLLKDVYAEIARSAKELASDTEQSYMSTSRMQIEVLKRERRYAEAGRAEAGLAESTPLRLPALNEKELSALQPGQISAMQSLYSETTEGSIAQRMKAVRSRLHIVELDLEDIATGAVALGPLTQASKPQLTAERLSETGLMQALQQKQQEVDANLQRIKANTQTEIDRQNKEAAEKANQLARKREAELERFINAIGRASAALEHIQTAALTRQFEGARTLYEQNHDVFAAEQGGTYTSITGGIPTGWQPSAFAMQNLRAASIVPFRRPSQSDQAAELTDWWTNVIQPQNRTADQQAISLLQLRSQHDRAGMDPAEARDNTIATLNAELRIKSIHADIWDMDKARFDAGIEALKAEYDYEQKIDAIKKQQTDAARNTAGSFFDAMRGHSTQQFFRSFAQGQERAIFENVAGPMVKSATNLLGGAGGMLPKIGGLDIFHGTVLDRANAAPERTAQNTDAIAKNTAQAVEELKALRTAATGQSGDPAAAMPPDLFNLPSINAFSRFNPILTGTGGLLGTGIGAGSTAASGSGAIADSSLFAAGGGSGPAQFFSGMGALGSDPLSAVFKGMSTHGNTTTQLTGAQQAGAAVAMGAMLTGAGLAISSGLSEGGTGGILKAAGGGLTAAALVPGPQQPFVMAGAAAATVLSSMFSTGREQRARDIFNELGTNQYLAPTALNVTQGADRTYEDFGARGNLRTSTMLALPTVTEPYITSRVFNGQRIYYDAPGQVTQPFAGGAHGTGIAPVSNAPVITGGTTVIVNGGVHTMDSESFHNFLQRPGNSMAVGESLASHLQSHEGRASNAIRYVAGAG
jgi:hypothetical protein